MEPIDQLILQQEVDAKGAKTVKRKLQNLGKSSLQRSRYGMTYQRVDKYIIDCEFEGKSENPIAIEAKRRIAALEEKRPTIYEGRETEHDGFYRYTPANNSLSEYTRYWFEGDHLKLQTTWDADDKDEILKVVSGLCLDE
jgi:hypothetical protein